MTGRPGPPRSTRLETPRLELRPFRLDDVGRTAEVLGDPVSMRFYPYPLSLEETRLWVSPNITPFEQDGLGLWAVEHRDTGGVVGDRGAVPQRVDGSDEPELGWHLHPAH